MTKDKIVKNSVISVFVALYVLVSLISTVHVIDFFELSNPRWMAITLAIGFELGAAASLASLVILDKMNKSLVWALFIVITAMQVNGNLYYAFTNLEDFQSWSELFNLIEEEPIYQKRILAFVSGAILPLVALGFIKSLVDYIKPVDREDDFTPSESMLDDIEEDTFEDLDSTLEDGLEDLDDDLFADMESYVKPQDEEQEEVKDFRSQFPEPEIAIESTEEEFDEDHALDQVMNTMIEEIEDSEEDDDDLLKKALKRKAEQEKKDFLNQKRGAE